MELTDIDRQNDAEALAKVATDRCELQKHCEHEPGKYIAGTTMRLCVKPECRAYIPSNDLFQPRRDSWMTK